MLSAGECAERNKLELEYGCKGFNFEFAKEDDARALMWRGPGIDEHARPHATLICVLLFLFWRGVCVGCFPLML